MARTARDIMETHVVAVSPQDPLSNVHRLFADEGISGAPVVDEQGRIVGVITATDLLRANADDHEAATADPDYFRAQLEFSSPDLAAAPEDFLDRLGERRVEDCMSPDVALVAPEASIPEVARAMRSQRIHRVLVAEDDRLVGIVTTFDLVGLLEKE